MPIVLPGYFSIPVTEERHGWRGTACSRSCRCLQNTRALVYCDANAKDNRHTELFEREGRIFTAMECRVRESGQGDLLGSVASMSELKYERQGQNKLLGMYSLKHLCQICVVDSIRSLLHKR
ncbi:hypothetical protein BT96DRAFT_674277 [Gymnopus androsaceus JB14]|uniref:Uncharacterized protein n=1 Tax=Gymnopus androsaceus JB14 TaxID=1447944 RepID=A0A6A4HQK6_9AGAR|nr:hypothetical protein BT96DRAFT_674277 [Gymnopus androsaceus JB14]